MKKRILALLMALVLVLGILPVSSIAAEDEVVIETGHVAEFMTDQFLGKIVLKGVSGTASGSGNSWEVELAEGTDITKPITFEITSELFAANLKTSRYFWVDGVCSEKTVADADPGQMTVLPKWENGCATVRVSLGTSSKEITSYILELRVKGLAKEDFNTVKLAEAKTKKYFVTKVTLAGADAIANVVSDTDFSGSSSGHKATVEYTLAQMPTAPVQLTFAMAATGSMYVSCDGGAREAGDGTYTATVDLNAATVYTFITYSTSSNSTVRGTYTVKFKVEGADLNTAPALKDSKGEEKSLTTGQTYTLNLAELFQDGEKDPLTYTVQIGEDKPVSAAANYSLLLDKAGEYTLVFRANDGKLTSEDAYTVTLKVAENTAPALVGEATDSQTLEQYEVLKLDLNKLFADAEGNALTYTVQINGDSAQAAAANYSYTANEEGTFTLVFRAKDHALTSPAYTLTLTVKHVPRTQIPTTCTGNVTGETWVKEITVAGAEIDSYEWNVAAGHAESDTHILNIRLKETTKDDQTLQLSYAGGYATNGFTGSISGPASVTLQDGEGSVTVTTKGWMNKGTPKTYILQFTNKRNQAPVATQPTATAQVATGSRFAMDLSKVFSDPDGDAMTYTVTVDGKTTETQSSFAQMMGKSGTYTFTFTAKDVWNETATHTVTVTVSQSSVTYDVTVKVPTGINPEFYITDGFDSQQVDRLGDKLTATKGGEKDGFVSYTLQIPEGVSRVSFRDGTWGGMSAEVSKGMAPVTIVKVLGVIPSKVNNVYATADQAKFLLQDKDGCYATCGSTTTDSYGIVNYRFLAVAFGTDDLALAYTTHVIPQGSLTATYTNSQGGNKTFTKDQPQQITQLGMTLKSSFAVTVPKGATVQAFQWVRYYKADEIPVSDTVVNADGTVTWLFVKGNAAYMTYRASMEGKLTKAGYVNGDKVAITWDENDPSPDCRTPYDTSTLYGSRGDDSLLVNVNGQNNLVLINGATFRLRGYRTWEIINNDTQNVMIQPDMHYTVTGDDILTVKPVSAGNGKNNWLDLTANGTGVSYLEVSYDAMQIVTGNQEGWGGTELAGFVFNACDPARTALVVVQVGNAANDVSFGIQGTSQLNGKAVPWDAEFDTLYFVGDSGQLKLAPTVTSGSVAKVEVSNDKGATWTELTAEGGVYTATIVSGNNILRVTKNDGTESYQVVRGDRVTVAMTDKGDGDGIPEAGETFRVKLQGVHNPIAKMSGNYNPGYGAGQHLYYRFNENWVSTTDTVQYNFVTNAWVDVTIPKDAKPGDTFSLTDGYIGFNVMGIADFTNDKENHRGIGDDGCSTRGSGGTDHTRSILPEITLTVRDSQADVQSVIEKINAIGDVTLEDAVAIAAARAEYNQLTAGQKEQIDPALVAKLETAEKTLVALQDQQAADQVDKKIAAIGEVTLEDEGAILAARSAYQALTADQQKLVTKLPALEQAEKELAVLKTTGGVDYGLSPDEIVGYVTISFVDYGVRVAGETIAPAYQNPRGVIIAPTKVPFKPYDTIATVTLRLLASKGIKASYTGNEFSGFYLSAVGDLAEFSAGSGSGWMVTQNGWFINKGASEFTVAEGDVIAWQYTCQLGKDIGDNSYYASVSDVIEKINAIGTVTLESKEKLQAARAAYDKLTEQEKKRVTNLDKLTAAEKKLAELEATEADKKAAEAVVKLIDGIGTVTPDSQEKIQAARKAYDSLTDLQKLLVENFPVLVKAEQTLNQQQTAGAVADIYKTTGDYLENLGTPGVNAVGGEWMVIGLARSGRKVPAGYYDNVLGYVQEHMDENGRLHSAKSTENARVILALTAIGKDVTDVGGHDLLAGLNSMDYIQKQGINGPIWALIAFDSGNYPIPEGDVTREKLIQVILDAQLPDGGWALSGTVSDPDMTGMALQALAPHYKTNADVKAAVDVALVMLTHTQGEDGGFVSIDGTNSESVAQVVVALTALGIDPATDSRFVKNGVSLLDALCAYYVEGGGFRHTPDGEPDGMATEQGYYALTAYYRMLDGKTSLYDMTDVVDKGGAVKSAETTTPPVQEVSGSVLPWVIVIILVVGAIVVMAILKCKKRKKA